MHRAFNPGRRRFLATAAATIAGMEFGMPIADRQFEIEFLDPGVEAFCFTFG